MPAVKCNGAKRPLHMLHFLVKTFWLFAGIPFLNNRPVPCLCLQQVQPRQEAPVRLPVFQVVNTTTYTAFTFDPSPISRHLAISDFKKVCLFSSAQVHIQLSHAQSSRWLAEVPTRLQTTITNRIDYFLHAAWPSWSSGGIKTWG